MVARAMRANVSQYLFKESDLSERAKSKRANSKPWKKQLLGLAKNNDHHDYVENDYDKIGGK